ncbi:MAG: type III pantothenate kinase [Candidatus Omnitrophota bacterium]|jgi:type III pantothenate kinase|nr:MAG: type III pantothenate kinase [Candidatus Omnitrophota bacterium]
MERNRLRYSNNKTRIFIAVDVGNTNINFGIFKRNALVREFIIPTCAYSLAKLRKHFGQGSYPGSAFVCSVVPDINKRLKRDLTVLGFKAYIIGKDIKVPIRNNYRYPSQVGQDRLVNAYASLKIYGKPLIIIDFGTAITFDIVSGKGVYLGGMILPGFSISLDALCEKTALLPKVKLGLPPEFIGRDTRNSILSGLVYGFAGLTDGFCRKIRFKLGKRTKVIATGGSLPLIRKFVKQINFFDKNLILKGLYMLYESKAQKKDSC